MSAPPSLGTGGAAAAGLDEHDVSRVRDAPGRLSAFNAAGVLAPADIHVAATLGRLAGETSGDVLLAAALAVRAVRLQHVCVDLATVAETVTVDESLGVVPVVELEWPEPGPWIDAVAGSDLVAVATGAPVAAGSGSIAATGAGLVAGTGGDLAARAAEQARPLRIAGSLLYLDRYWRYERRVVAALRARATAVPDGVDETVLADGLDRLFPPGGGSEPDLQRLAAATAVRRRLTVIAGGPGTGKTTTVARVLALIEEQAVAAGQAPPLTALAAPTGKAADRLGESIAGSVATLDTGEDIRARIAALSASTLHRLLGTWPGNRTRFRHDRDRPLPHDLVIVDETSMVSLALIAKLLDAVRPDARLVLLGDPGQLASVEAGAVLGDVVGPAGDVRGDVAAGRPSPHGERPPGSVRAPVRDSIVVLRRVHRFREDSGIAALASAVQRSDADAALAVLEAERPDLSWIDVDVGLDGPDDARMRPVRKAISAAGAALHTAAAGGDARAALSALAELRVLCAHRRGPAGVAAWVPVIERWLAADVPAFATTDTWYTGRPVLITENDYQLGLYNGDVGVVGAFDDGPVTVAFEDGDGVRLVRPTRLESVETVHAMTIHKSQGSQFRSVVVILPDADSPLLTRELLYTAVTRARERMTLVGTAHAVRAAATRPIQRASGLRQALWGV